MSWGYEYPKNKRDALMLLVLAYTNVTFECPSVEFDGKEFKYNPTTVNGWFINGKPCEGDIPDEAINAMFEKYRMWWAEQLDCMNMINEEHSFEIIEFNLCRIIYSWREPEDGIEQIVCMLSKEEEEALQTIFLEFEKLAGDEYGNTLARWKLNRWCPTDNYNWTEQAWNVKRTLEEILLQSRYNETRQPGEYYQGGSFKFEDLLRTHGIEI